jgi:hypothetical protein
MAVSWLCATLLLSNTAQATGSFGVGFSLSDEYGYGHQTPKTSFRLTSKHSVASVAFHENNRSWTWNVAKIAGSRLYSQTMDSASHFPIEMMAAEVPDPCEPVEPRVGCGNPCLELWEPIPQRPLGLQLLYAALPSWLGGDRPDEASRVLKEMLRALKTATETALDTEIDEVYISTPVLVHQPFEDRLKAASSALGFKQPSDSFWAAEALSTSTSSWCSCVDQPSNVPGDGEVVLVLDHTDAALTATLGVTNICDLDARRVLRSTELGAWRLRNLSWWEYDSEAEKELLLQQRYPMLVDALRRLTAFPLEAEFPWREDFAGVKEDFAALDRLILLGETANDEKLHAALGEVFGERLEGLLASGGWNGSMTKHDPLYAAAEYVAKCSLESKKLRSSERMEL